MLGGNAPVYTKGLRNVKPHRMHILFPIVMAITGAPGRRLRFEACLTLCAALALPALFPFGIAKLAHGMEAGPAAMLGIGAFTVLAACVLFGLPWHSPHTRFGAANIVTTVRAAGVCALAGLLITTPGLWRDGWIVAVLAISVTLLDALDGWLARRSGLQSPFGARFDMEADALAILVLSALVAHSGKVGLWVLLLGAGRYLFAAAGLVWPALTADLPPSARRRVVCALLQFALAASLTPIVDPASATLAAAATLVLLAWSFGVDLTWLARRAERRPSTTH